MMLQMSVILFDEAKLNYIYIYICRFEFSQFCYTRVLNKRKFQIVKIELLDCQDELLNVESACHAPVFTSKTIQCEYLSY